MKRWQNFKDRRSDVVNGYIDAKKKQRRLEMILRLVCQTFILRYLGDQINYINYRNSKK